MYRKGKLLICLTPLKRTGACEASAAVLPSLPLPPRSPRLSSSFVIPSTSYARERRGPGGRRMGGALHHPARRASSWPLRLGFFFLEHAVGADGGSQGGGGGMPSPARSRLPERWPQRQVGRQPAALPCVPGLSVSFCALAGAAAAAAAGGAAASSSLSAGGAIRQAGCGRAASLATERRAAQSGACRRLHLWTCDSFAPPAGPGRRRPHAVSSIGRDSDVLALSHQSVGLVNLA